VVKITYPLLDKFILGIAKEIDDTFEWILTVLVGEKIPFTPRLLKEAFIVACEMVLEYIKEELNNIPDKELKPVVDLINSKFMLGDISDTTGNNNI